MKKEKKSRFWTFWFSFLPGAAEMYMGFMKMGVSLLTVFFISIFVAYFLDMGALLCATCIIWFYSFFHARNLARLSSAELQAVEDDYLIDFSNVSSTKIKDVFANQKVFAWVFIVIGGYLIWKGCTSAVISALPERYYWNVSGLVRYIEKIALGVIIVLFGVKIIRGKKGEILNPSNPEAVILEVEGTEEDQDVQKEKGVKLEKDTKDEEGVEAADGREENA